MLIDTINTVLEFITIMVLFSTFTGRKFWTAELILYFPISILLSVYFCLDIPHFLFVKLILFGLSLYVSFHSVDRLDRIIAASTSLLVLITIEFVLLSFLPEAILHTLIGDSMVNVIMVFFVCVICFVVYKLNYSSILLAYIRRYFLVILSILILWGILGQTYLRKVSELWAYIPGFVSLGILLLFCLGIVLDVSYQKSVEHKKMNMYEKNMQTIDLYIDQLKRENHDYKHHINYLIDLVATSEDKETALSAANNYLVTLETSHEIIDSILSIDNTLYKAVLFGTYNQCQKLGIPFSLECSPMLPAFPLEEYQMVEILENLISNALEYNQTLPVENRSLKITLLADITNNQFAITNPYCEQEQDISAFFKKGFTSKQEHHLGYGLYSIKEKIRQSEMEFYEKKNPSENSITFTLRYSPDRTLRN